MVIVKQLTEMESVIQVQILGEAVWISFHINALGKSMNPFP